MQGCGRGACARTVVRGSGGGGCGVPVTVRSGSGCGGSLSDKPPASRGKAGSAGPASAGESAPDLGAFGSVNDDRAMARTLDRTFRGEGAHPGSPCRVGGAQLPAACPSPDGPPHGAPPPPPRVQGSARAVWEQAFLLEVTRRCKWLWTQSDNPGDICNLKSALGKTQAAPCPAEGAQGGHGPHGAGG